MRWAASLLVLAACAGLTTTHAVGQGTGAPDYPSRGITMVMPLAPEKIAFYSTGIAETFYA